MRARRLRLRLGVVNRSITVLSSPIALVAVTLLELVVASCSSGIGVHGRPLRAVALAAVVELIRVSVLGESVVRVDGLDGVAPEETAKEAAALLGGAGCVVVLGAGSKAPLPAVVTLESDFHENGEDEEEAVNMVSE